MGIVHDFRNVLALIESSLRLAESNSNEPEKVHIFIAGAREGVKHAVKLTSRLLTFTKHHNLDIQPADTQEHCRCDSLGRETVHRLRVDGVDRPGVPAEFTEQLGQKERIAARGLRTRPTELLAGVLAHAPADQAGDRFLTQRTRP